MAEGLEDDEVHGREDRAHAIAPETGFLAGIVGPEGVGESLGVLLGGEVHPIMERLAALVARHEVVDGVGQAHRLEPGVEFPLGLVDDHFRVGVALQLLQRLEDEEPRQVRLARAGEPLDPVEPLVVLLGEDPAVAPVHVLPAGMDRPRPADQGEGDRVQGPLEADLRDQVVAEPDAEGRDGRAGHHYPRPVYEDASAEEDQADEHHRQGREEQRRLGHQGEALLQCLGRDPRRAREERNQDRQREQHHLAAAEDDPEHEAHGADIDSGDDVRSRLRPPLGVVRPLAHGVTPRARGRRCSPR